MSDHCVRERLLVCFHAVFPDAGDEGCAAFSADTNPAWDSVTQVTLVSLIEEEFAIRLEEERYGELTSFSSFLAYLETSKS